MLLCSFALCVLLSLNLSRAEGIPSEARTAAKKFQNALTQQNVQTVLSSIEERLRNLDTIYSMQYSPSVEGKLETYGRKLESVEAKISRLEAVMSNELDKISENISSRNFKDDLSRDHLLRKIDSLYDRVNHRLIFAESKMDLIERKIENKLDAVLLRIEKMEDSLEIKDADMQGEIGDVLSCIEELKTRTDSIERKIVNVSKTLNEDARVKNIQADEMGFSSTYENITNTMRKDMKEHFEVLSNKIVDFHESSWKTYDRLEGTLRSMSLVSNLTRYEIQNGLRSLTVEVGRLGGGGGLVSDSSKEKSKLHEIDKKIDSNFESLMLAQNLFMENCYRLQKDEPQLETKISEVLDQMITTFSAKTAVEPKDIKRLEQLIKNHDQGVRNGFKNLGSILHDSRMNKKQVEDAFTALGSIKSDLAKLGTSGCDGEINVTYRKMDEAVSLLENLQNTTTDLHQSMQNAIADRITTSHLQQAIEKLGNFIDTNNQQVLQNHTKTYTHLIKEFAKNIENINKTETIFNEYYTHHFKLFLDEYARNYIKRINEIFGTNNTEDFATYTTEINVVREIDNELVEIIKTNCFAPVDNRSLGELSTFNCLKGILKEDVIEMIQNYCSISTGGLSEEACLRKIAGLTNNENAVTEIDSVIIESIKTNCFNLNAPVNSTNFECLQGALNEEEIQQIKSYCLFYTTLSNEGCLRNITGMQSTKTLIAELGSQTIEMIKTNCFPSIDLRSLQNNTSNFGCLKGILSESIIVNIKNYCLLNLALPEEACLVSIIGLKSSTNITEELGVETIEAIKSNCFPNIDLRSIANNTSNFECLKGFLNDSIIENIKNHCLVNLPWSEEVCLMNITGLKFNINIIEEVDTKTIDIIRNNCFPEIDIRKSEMYVNYECIQGVLNETLIEKIRNYCLINLLSSEEACLKNITDLRPNENFLGKINSEILEVIKSNCLLTVDVRQSVNSSAFKCLEGVLDGDVIEGIKNYCNFIKASSEEVCLRNMTGLKTTTTVNIETITKETIEIIRSNCFPLIDLRSNENSTDFECFKGLLSNASIRSIKGYCSLNMIDLEEACLRKLLVEFADVSETSSNVNQNTTVNIVLNETNENLQTFTIINTNSDIETTTEIDYYQNIEVMEPSQYDDYSSTDDSVL